MAITDSSHTAHQSQRYDILCVAFCCASMASFIERAVSATATICTLPVWANRPCAGMIGASAAQYRATTPKEFVRQLDAWMRCNVPSKRDLFGFALCAGDDPFNPEVSIEIIADRDAERADGPVRHLFQLRLPPDALAPTTATIKLDFLVDVLQHLPIESGYVAPAISWTRHPTAGRPNSRHAAPAFSNLALDIHANMATRFVIGGRCRGARSLTLLDQRLLSKMGGDEAIQRLQSADLSVKPFLGGVIIQVSDTPLQAVRVDTPVFARYSALAQELEGITLFDDLELERLRFNANPDALDRYERRFMI